MSSTALDLDVVGEIPAKPCDRLPIRLMYVISSLEYGGAEGQVVQLANHLPADRFDVRICSLSPIVPLADQLQKRGRQLYIVPKRWRYDWTTVSRVAALMREHRTEIAHGFLFDAEMVTRLAARRAGVPAVIASERNTDYRRTFVQWLGQRLTRSWFDVMVANSYAGKRFNMKTLGLSEERIHVVHNGVDVEHFRAGCRDRVRQELGIAPDDLVVGMVASFKRQKNHAAFFRMAARLLERFPRTWFLCVGEPLRDNLQGAEDYHAEMRVLVRSLGIESRVMFLGNRSDMPEVYGAMDVGLLTSRREGTPNVLLEAMACGVPVVATDVADNAYVVPDGQAGFVVPLDDHAALVERVSRVLADPELRVTMGRRARNWVESEFSISALLRRTAGVYTGCLKRKTGRGS